MNSLTGQYESPPERRTFFCLDSCPVASQFGAQFLLPSTAHTIEQGVEFLAVVGVPQMTQFVKDDIVPQMGGQTHEPQVEIDVTPGGAASPVRGVVLDEDTLVFAMAVR